MSYVHIIAYHVMLCHNENNVTYFLSIALSLSLSVLSGGFWRSSELQGQGWEVVHSGCDQLCVVPHLQRGEEAHRVHPHLGLQRLAHRRKSGHSPRRWSEPSRLSPMRIKVWLFGYMVFDWFCQQSTTSLCWTEAFICLVVFWHTQHEMLLIIFSFVSGHA